MWPTLRSGQALPTAPWNAVFRHNARTGGPVPVEQDARQMGRWVWPGGVRIVSNATGRFPDHRTALCQWFGDRRQPTVAPARLCVLPFPAALCAAVMRAGRLVVMVGVKYWGVEGGKGSEERRNRHSYGGLSGNAGIPGIPCQIVASSAWGGYHASMTPPRVYCLKVTSIHTLP